MVDLETRMRLYRAGLLDNQIAAFCGVTTPPIWKWRRRLGLPSNYKAMPDAKAEDRLSLYEAGLSDLDISRRQGVSRHSVWLWRQRHKLHYSTANWHKRRLRFNEERLQYWTAGAPDVLIAALVGCTRVSVQKWRQKRRLPAKHYPKEARVREISLDIHQDGFRASFHELVADDRWSSWLEEMGATVW